MVEKNYRLWPLPEMNKSQRDAWVAAMARCHELELALARMQQAPPGLVEQKFRNLKNLIVQMSDVRDREFNDRRNRKG